MNNNKRPGLPEFLEPAGFFVTTNPARRRELEEKLRTWEHAYAYIFDLPATKESCTTIEQMLWLELAEDRVRPVVLRRMLGRLHALRNTIEREQIERRIGRTLPR